ncbi:MAG: hypothetical protein GX444_00395 [Myxococcales bacterium]|nr:hypothetical protein [Myxococcales bacterium]
MSRKSFAGLVILAVVLTASLTFAAEKLDNVFIAGLDGGYYGYTGWMGDNFDGGFGGALFFGYGITRNFSIELDYIPAITTSPSGDDVKEGLDAAYWGGLGQEYSGIGGIGVSGKLYPRDRFRDADFVRLQPVLRMGLGWMPFMWTYKDSTKVPAGQVALYNNEDYDGFNNLYVNIGGGLDVMLAKWISLGLDLRLWKAFIIGDTLNGYATDDENLFKDDYESSMMYSLGLNVTFQW